MVGATDRVTSSPDRRPSPVAALAVVLGLAAAVILVAGRGIALIGDQWVWLFSALNPGPRQIFQDFNGHLMVTTYGLYDLLAPLGLAQFWVHRVVAVLLHLTIAALVFCLARQRLGPWLALAPAALVAFLGTGADAFVSGQNYNVLAATAASLAALLALARRTRLGDLAACALLALGLASFTLAAAYTAGVAVELLLQRDRRRLWIPLAPAAMYAVWRLRLGSNNEASAQSALESVHNAFEAATGAFAGLAGVQLANFSVKAHLPWLSPAAQVVLAGAIGVGAWMTVRQSRVSPRLANLAAAGVILWLLIGFARGSQDPASSRYVYQGAVLGLLILVELVSPYRDVSATRRIVAVVVPVAIALNVLWLGVYDRALRRDSAVIRAQLAALELARGRVPGNFQPAPGFQLGHVTAEPYFEAVKRFGDSPAYTLSELRRAGEHPREAADRVLLDAFRLGSTGARTTADGPPPPVDQIAAGRVVRRGRCVTLVPTAGRAEVEVTLRPGSGLALTGAMRGVQVRRFGERFVHSVASARSRGLGVDAPLDRAPDSWHVRVATTAPTRICSARPAAASEGE